MTCPAIRFDAQGAYFVKHPDAVLDVGFDWGEWLTTGGQTALDSSTWAAASGLTATAPKEADGITAVLVSGGADGQDYMLTNTVSAGALRDVRSLRVKVRA